jgi:hypothetical protein
LFALNVGLAVAAEARQEWQILAQQEEAVAAAELVQLSLSMHLNSEHLSLLLLEQEEPEERGNQAMIPMEITDRQEETLILDLIHTASLQAGPAAMAGQMQLEPQAQRARVDISITQLPEELAVTATS